MRGAYLVGFVIGHIHHKDLEPEPLHAAVGTKLTHGQDNIAAYGFAFVKSIAGLDERVGQRFVFNEFAGIRVVDKGSDDGVWPVVSGIPEQVPVVIVIADGQHRRVAGAHFPGLKIFVFQRWDRVLGCFFNAAGQHGATNNDDQETHQMKINT